MWFAQRAAEQEKERVVHHLHTSGIRGATLKDRRAPATPLTVSAGPAGFPEATASSSEYSRCVRSEDVLDQLTQRITGAYDEIASQTGPGYLTF